MVGHSRPERVFSVGHTGGDLSLPDEVKARVMPKPFPIAEDVPTWTALVSKAESEAPGGVAGGEGGPVPPA
jgi:hypothetical protein